MILLSLADFRDLFAVQPAESQMIVALTPTEEDYYIELQHNRREVERLLLLGDFGLVKQ